MEDLIAITLTPEQPIDVDDELNFFAPQSPEACLAVDSFLVTGLQRRLVQLFTSHDAQLDEAMGHISAIEKLLGFA